VYLSGTKLYRKIKIASLRFIPQILKVLEGQNMVIRVVIRMVIHMVIDMVIRMVILGLSQMGVVLFIFADLRYGFYTIVSNERFLFRIGLLRHAQPRKPKNEARHYSLLQMRKVRYSR
jgi:hypothetical protein